MQYNVKILPAWQMANAGHKGGGDWNPSKPYITVAKFVTPNDKSWNFEYEDTLQTSLSNITIVVEQNNSTIPMKCLKITNRDIVLSCENIPPTRMTMTYPEKFLCVSFANLNFEDRKKKRFDYDTTSKYIHRVLNSGVKLNGTRYEFCGHSNSQLRSRCCYFRVLDKIARIPYVICLGKKEVPMLEMLNKCGDFEGINNVPKRAKRIGLLFTSSHLNFNLSAEDTKIIKDVAKDERIFTDGCGFIDSKYANEICEHIPGFYKGKKCFNSSVLQIRYQGFKGIVAAIPTSQIQHLTVEDKSRGERIITFLLSWLNIQKKGEIIPRILFRKSMNKFDGCFDDKTFCIVGHSKPYGCSNLNADLITLLATLGIPDAIFEKRLNWHLKTILELPKDVDTAMEFCIHKNRFKTVIQLLDFKRQGSAFISEELSRSLLKVQKDEKESFYKDDKLKIRIIVPKSRLLFGISDPTGILRPGECFVKYTQTVVKENQNFFSQEEIKLKGRIIVSRNPCLHPGDIQHFTAVAIPELDYLVDCIVFSVHGDIPAALTMSGGDLDGDKFFVCWDPELIPAYIYKPEDYSKCLPSLKKNNNILQDDLKDNFSMHNTFYLARLKKLYLRWVKGDWRRAGSPQCIELNRLHSKCVDGGEIFIPPHLKKPPPAIKPEFILDILERIIKQAIPHDKLVEDDDDDNFDFGPKEPEPEVEEELRFPYFALFANMVLAIIMWIISLVSYCKPDSGPRSSKTMKARSGKTVRCRYSKV